MSPASEGTYRSPVQGRSGIRLSSAPAGPGGDHVRGVQFRPPAGRGGRSGVPPWEGTVNGSGRAKAPQSANRPGHIFSRLHGWAPPVTDGGQMVTGRKAFGDASS